MPNNAAYEQHFYTYISSSTPQPFSNSASGSNAYKVQYNLVIADEQGDYNITNYQYTSSFVTTVNSFITASLYVTNNVFPSGYSCSIQILKNNTIIKESQKLVSLSNQGIGTSVAINEINPGDVFEVRLSAGEPTVNPNPLTITTNIGTYFSIVPRTGSTSLLKKISEEQKVNPINEPFNDVNGNLENYKDYNWKNTNNICVKTHINHKDISFYLEFIKYFDEVILLSRKDLMACAESLSYANHFQNFVNNYNWVRTPNLNQTIKLVKEFNEELEKLSKLTNIKISYYEDLFNLESEDKLRKNDIKPKSII